MHGSGSLSGWCAPCSGNASVNTSNGWPPARPGRSKTWSSPARPVNPCATSSRCTNPTNSPPRPACPGSGCTTYGISPPPPCSPPRSPWPWRPRRCGTQPCRPPQRSTGTCCGTPPTKPSTPSTTPSPPRKPRYPPPPKSAASTRRWHPPRPQRDHPHQPDPACYPRQYPRCGGLATCRPQHAITHTTRVNLYYKVVH